MILIRIAGELREPGGVGLGDRATEGMLVGRAHLEILEETAELCGDDVGHACILPHEWSVQRGLGCEVRDCYSPLRSRQRSSMRSMNPGLAGFDGFDLAAGWPDSPSAAPATTGTLVNAE